MTQSTTSAVTDNGNIPPHNWVHLALLVFSLPWLLIQLVYRRLLNLGHNEISFKEDLALSLIRRTENILNSPRFCSKSTNLYQRVLQQNVAGYWLCKGPAGKAVDPGSCDIIIYYLHGGAYVSGHPGTFLLAALRIAEIADERGISISCFGLQYSLAPEAKFPTQLEQAVAGYKYLLDQNIDVSKIAVLGDSAGGHLALCLMTSLKEAQLPKPGRGIFLVSPWIDLLCLKRATYESNKYMDYISRKSVLKASKHLLGKDIKRETAACIDFTQPLPGSLSWKDILPARVWLSAGSHEVLLQEIEEFARCLREDGVDVHLRVERGGVHCWQGMKDVWDMSKYLRTTDSSLPEGLLTGTAAIGNAMLSDMKST
ncbi:alpha/beta hydrolase fold protein [Penicillium robsamsonii]|uniref:alpha/beta hydrolase fold protein n=1 Tax=Penicillium robsamsonii TaxID=1792511 RepID=UPI002548B090|nr:alpha/beta hydrolase fold protein [Penicillium robsamsonii]KAJ5807586.1 alpha/beta hydrolase fold protein [Penicillium robsamsonii]